MERIFHDNKEYVLSKKPAGEGVFGKVYRAESDDGSVVAVKIIKEEHKDKPIELSFLESVLNMQTLNHPNILPILDVTEHDNRTTVVMPFVEQRLTEKIPSMSLDEKIAAAEQMMDALEYSHKQGVIHRDLHLGNILHSGVVLLADYGIPLSDFENQLQPLIAGYTGYCQYPRLTPTSTIPFSEKAHLKKISMYIAPEIFQRQEVGPWTDIYSLARFFSNDLFYQELGNNKKFWKELMLGTIPAPEFRREIYSDVATFRERVFSKIKKNNVNEFSKPVLDRLNQEAENERIAIANFQKSRMKNKKYTSTDIRILKDRIQRTPSNKAMVLRTEIMPYVESLESAVRDALQIKDEWEQAIIEGREPLEPQMVSNGGRYVFAEGFATRYLESLGRISLWNPELLEIVKLLDEGPQKKYVVQVAVLNDQIQLLTAYGKARTAHPFFGVHIYGWYTKSSFPVLAGIMDKPKDTTLEVLKKFASIPYPSSIQNAANAFNTIRKLLEDEQTREYTWALVDKYLEAVNNRGSLYELPRQGMAEVENWVDKRGWKSDDNEYEQAAESFRFSFKQRKLRLYSTHIVESLFYLIKDSVSKNGLNLPDTKKFQQVNTYWEVNNKILSYRLNDYGRFIDEINTKGPRTAIRDLYMERLKESDYNEYLVERYGPPVAVLLGIMGIYGLLFTFCS